MMNLNSASPSTPQWARSDKRYIGSQVPSLRHKSSFSTPDRHPNSNPSSGLRRHGSVSGAQRSAKNSPPDRRTAPGYHSFGTPKPFQARRSDAIDESDLPPPDSIYDSGILPFFNKRPSDPAAQQAESANGSFPTPATLDEYSPSNENVNNMSVSGPSSSLARTPSNSRRLSSNYVSAQLPSPVRPANSGTNNTSVAIFGFPSAMSTVVLRHFANFGQILENIPAASSANANSRQDTPLPVHAGKNWLKLTYNNPHSAARALTENGKTIGGYAIGCVAWTPEFETGARRPLEPADDILEIDMDKAAIDEEAPPIVSIRNKYLNDEEADSSSGKEKVVPRTISMPLLAANSKRLEVHDGQFVFTHPKGRGLRFAPSLANLGQVAAAATAPSNDKKQLKQGKQNWLSWTTKRAQEFVFGWDDL